MYGPRLTLLNDERTHTITYFLPEQGVTDQDILQLIERTGRKEGEEFAKLRVRIAKNIHPPAN